MKFENNFGKSTGFAHFMIHHLIQPRPRRFDRYSNREYIKISQYSSKRAGVLVLPKHPRALATVLTDLYIFSITVSIKAPGTRLHLIYDTQLFIHNTQPRLLSELSAVDFVSCADKLYASVIKIIHDLLL